MYPPEYRNTGTHTPTPRPTNLEVGGKAGNGAGDEVGGQEGGDADHGEAAVLELLELHLPALVLLLGVALEVVDDGLAVAGVGLALEGLLVLVGLEGAAEDDELGPPLGVGLHDGAHGVGRGDVLGVEGAEGVGEEPTDGGEHGRAAVGQLGLAGPLGGDPLGEVERVEELAAGLEVNADQVVVTLRDGGVELGREGGLLSGSKGGGGAGQGEGCEDGLHLACLLAVKIGRGRRRGGYGDTAMTIARRSFFRGQTSRTSRRSSPFNQRNQTQSNESDFVDTNYAIARTKAPANRPTMADQSPMPIGDAASTLL
mmetsp:Transcript_4921/g.13949  ORF Transcript_4921/g.13949 Transcript_4921/m.13949 type:complete len:313 (-) Transcript_4921:184-1122(-)